MLGAGGGMAFLPLLVISMSEVPMADAGLASGFSNVAMQIGGALGLAVMGAISTGRAQALVAQGEGASTALTGGYQLAFLLAAACVAAGLAVVLMVLRTTTQPVRVELSETEAEAA
jgi:hypothetical protein